MLDALYFGNTLRTWLIAIAVFVILTALLSIVKRVLVGRLKILAQKTTTDLDDLFVELIGRTRLPFLAAVSLYFASQFLHRTPEVQGYLRGLIVLILVIQAGIWANGLIAYGIRRATKKRGGPDSAASSGLSAIGFVARLVLWVIVLLLALDNLGINITALVAGLGVGGIAVALAVQNILGDLFASLSIVLDQPFVIGDFIVVDTMSGSVEHVGLKTTRIRSLSGEQIIVSNADLLRSRIRNYKRMQERRVVFTVGVEYNTPADKLEMVPGLLKEIVTSHAHVRFDRAHFQTFGESSLLFEVVYFVRDPDYNKFMDTQQAINLAVVRQFGAEGIRFAFPTRTVYVKS
jgi:small-conductance mechanosensitive channel